MNSKDCIFVYYEKDIAKCAIEKAYFENKINFRKPISCHLFPIRVNNLGGPILKYERYDECNPALDQGNKLDLSILEFCKDALIRAYGIEFYNNLLELKGS